MDDIKIKATISGKEVELTIRDLAMLIERDRIVNKEDYSEDVKKMIAGRKITHRMMDDSNFKQRNNIK